LFFNVNDLNTVASTTTIVQLVRPANKLIDYNTDFSGITAEHLEHVSATLLDAQRALSGLIGAGSVLVGHSLDSDLRVLHLVHGQSY
jgi:RNA exonuclease 1